MCSRQTLTKEEYAAWLRRHLEAETALQGREELLFDSALRLETNLHLLGKRTPRHRPGTSSDNTFFLISEFRTNPDVLSIIQNTCLFWGFKENLECVCFCFFGGGGGKRVRVPVRVMWEVKKAVVCV